MSISKIKIQNFKSFEKAEFELNKFNVLIGANSSGKSNFVQFLQFVRNISDYGLDNAVSMGGGIDYIRNLSLGANTNLAFYIEGEASTDVRIPLGIIDGQNKIIMIDTQSYRYDFDASFRKRKLAFDRINDSLILKGNFILLTPEKIVKCGIGSIELRNNNGQFENVLKIPNSLQEEELNLNMLPVDFFKDTVKDAKTILEISKIPSRLFCSDIAIFDFDPRLPKKAIAINGKVELEEDGSNLAIVLGNVIRNKEKKRRLSNLLNDVLPFISNLDVEKLSDKSLLFTLKENYSQNHVIPASLISDGTINIIALIIALYFEQKPIIILEEPERNIHPELISKMVNMMRDASNKKQIIITTHNAEVVRNAGIENLLLVSRNAEGFSTISSPKDNSVVISFLQDELGLDELFVSNMLGC
ncbi:MAG: AAA family ATPase [Oscillospiraceae bacterium]